MASRPGIDGLVQNVPSAMALARRPLRVGRDLQQEIRPHSFALSLVGGEEEGSVFDDWTTQGRAEIVVLEYGLPWLSIEVVARVEGAVAQKLES